LAIPHARSHSALPYCAHIFLEVTAHRLDVHSYVRTVLVEEKTSPAGNGTRVVTIRRVKLPQFFLNLALTTILTERLALDAAVAALADARQALAEQHGQEAE
jgi:hypothetical protein